MIFFSFFSDRDGRTIQNEIEYRGNPDWIGFKDRLGNYLTKGNI